MADHNSIVNRVDFKNLTIGHMNDILKSLNESQGARNGIIIFTNFGMVRGMLTEPMIESEESDSSVFQQVVKKAINFRDEDIADSEKEGNRPRPVSDQGFISLRNVKIHPYTSSTASTIEEMIIFTDQIVGVSFGVWSDS